MLTLNDLKEMPPNTIFASGITIDGPEGVNMTGSGKELKWVAVRGGIHDWAIYIHFSNNLEYVKNFGDKVHRESHIRMLVPCDDEAFEMYRH